MSHYIKVKTKFRDAAALMEALRAHFPEGSIEQLAEPRKIIGYKNKRGAACSIIVKKEGALRWGELGFVKGEDGTFEQHNDDLDEPVIAGLAQRYARVVTIKQAKLSGFTVQEVKAPDGTITLNLSKWS